MQEPIQHDAFLGHTLDVQKNVLPHDQLRNGKSLDDALWNGFEKPTGIQKAGLFIFAGFFMFIGLIGFVVADEIHARFIDFIGLAMVLIGLKIGSNAFRKRRKKN